MLEVPETLGSNKVMPLLLPKNASNSNTGSILFGMLLVEMATGRKVHSLDGISTAAASGSLQLSLPVLQVINAIIQQTSGAEEFSFQDVIALPFFSQYTRPSVPETEVKFGYQIS